MAEGSHDPRRKTRLVHSHLPWTTHPLLPADLGSELCEDLLRRENLLEDAHYLKIVPNRFWVEVSVENYARHYQPLLERVVQQWQVKIIECLSTANSRLGRKEYAFVGKVNIEIRAAHDLKNDQARISCQIVPESTPAAPKPSLTPPPSVMTACLEDAQTGRLWPLHPGTMTLGRLNTCDIPLDSPQVRAERLISGQHAYLDASLAAVYLHDGAPNGRPSLNGTYVNRKRISTAGVELHDGDLIILAANDPADPQPDTPGVVSLYFRIHCPK